MDENQEPRYKNQEPKIKNQDNSMVKSINLSFLTPGS
jgi:hypothetical protein